MKYIVLVIVLVLVVLYLKRNSNNKELAAENIVIGNDF